jgi:putative serine protease PepD
MTQPPGHDPRHEPDQGHEHQRSNPPSPWQQPGPQQPYQGGTPRPQDPTQPQWYGPPAAQHQWPGAQYPGQPTTAGTTTATKGRSDRSGRSRWIELPVVAVLAAALASGSTYGLLHADQGQPAAATSTSQSGTAAPVAQADPSKPNWTATAAAVTPSVVAITVTNGQSGDQGSGVIIDDKGHIVTNNHVVAAAKQGARVTVTLGDNRTFRASVVGTDPSTDLAVISLDNPPSGLTPIAFAKDKDLKVGDPVMAVGNPLGLAGTVTTGIVSALDRPVTTQQESQSGPLSSQGEPVVTNAVQTSAAINPGNSGGALVNASGQLVGINSSIATLGQSQLGGSSQSGSIGIGFAIPVAEVRSISSQLIKDGTAEHAFLGVSLRDTTVKDGSAERAAALIAEVVQGSPADHAGLKKGDAVIAVDGEPINGSLSLVAQVHERSVGDHISLTVVRDGSRKDVGVTLTSKQNAR